MCRGGDQRHEHLGAGVATSDGCGGGHELRDGEDRLARLRLPAVLAQSLSTNTQCMLHFQAQQAIPDRGDAEPSVRCKSHRRHNLVRQLRLQLLPETAPIFRNEEPRWYIPVCSARCCETLTNREGVVTDRRNRPPPAQRRRLAPRCPASPQAPSPPSDSRQRPATGRPCPQTQPPRWHWPWRPWS